MLDMDQGAYARTRISNLSCKKILIALSDPPPPPPRHAARPSPSFGMEASTASCELMARARRKPKAGCRGHMKVLREAGLVHDRRDAQWVRYRRRPDLAPELTTVVDAVLDAERSLERQVA